MSSQAQQPVRRRASIGARRNPETEAAVMAAGRALLIEKGYAGFSVEEVARRAGAGKPTIYRWWPTKADLFIALYRAEKASKIPIPDNGALIDDLADFTAALWNFWRTNPAGGAFRGLIAEAQSNPAALAALRVKFLPERLEPVRSLFVRGSARGEIGPEDLDERTALWVGFCWFRLLTDQLDEDARFIRRAMAVLADSPKGTVRR